MRSSPSGQKVAPPHIRAAVPSLIETGPDIQQQQEALPRIRIIWIQIEAHPSFEKRMYVGSKGVLVSKGVLKSPRKKDHQAGREGAVSCSWV